MTAFTNTGSAIAPAAGQSARNLQCPKDAHRHQEYAQVLLAQRLLRLHITRFEKIIDSKSNG